MPRNKRILYVDGLPELMAQLKSGEDVRKVKSILLAGGMILKGYLSKYPPQKRLTRREVYGQPFKTAKQRRYFFYALRTGIIKIPYSRGSDPKSERFKASWAISTRKNGLTVVVGNDTTYGPYLMDPDKQSKFMDAIGWNTIDEVIDQKGDDVTGFMIYKLQREIGFE